MKYREVGRIYLENFKKIEKKKTINLELFKMQICFT
jgi:hypothetical protein